MNSLKPIRRSLLCAAVSVGIGNPPLSTAAATPAVISPADIVEEVVVTARKREENQYQVPLAITAFGRQQLASPLLGDISDLGDLAPNVDFNWTAPYSGSSNAASVFIRGVGQNDFLLTSDPAVGVYLDGVYVTRSVGAVLALTDVERVEILRGPQGTLFGKNSVGGAVQVISRHPGDELMAEAEVTLGADHRLDAMASVEGALGDHTQARLTLLSETQDGYVKRLNDGLMLGDKDRQSAKLVVTTQPSDRSQWTLSLDHTKQRQEAIAQSLIHITPDTPMPLRGLFNALVAPPDSPYDPRWMTHDPYTTHQTGPSADDLNISGLSVSAEYNFDWAEFTSITGYRRYSALYARDPDGSPLDYAHSINEDRHYQLSQEWRLNGSTESRRLDWLAGLYLLREHGTNRTDVTLWSGLYSAIGDSVVENDFEVNNDLLTQSAALFGQATFHVNDQWRLTAGLRTTREDKTFEVHNFKVLSGVQVLRPERVSRDWTNTSPMISVDYRWNDQWMSYASYSRGFKSGGFNGRQIFPGPVDGFDPEYASTVELGTKALLNDGQLSLRASLFSTDYKDMQFTVLDAGVIPVIDNAAKARIRGAELEVTARTLGGSRLQLGLGYLDARYRALDPGVLISKDMDLVRSPRWNAHVDIRKAWHLNSGSVTTTLNASYRSEEHHEPTNIEYIAQPGYTLINASAKWHSPTQNWSLEAFVSNLTDKRYIVSGSAELPAVGLAEGHYARGREWGLRLSMQFH